MGMTRKRFLQGAAGSTVALLLQSCGGGGGGSGGASTTGGGYGGGMMTPTGCSAETISANHGHTLSIPVADLDATTDKVYSIAGTAGHDHTITLTATQLATLKAGGTVTVTSSVTNAPTFGSHSHAVTVGCM